MNKELYNSNNEIELTTEVVHVTEDGYARANIRQVNIQTLSRGRRRMYAPMIAKENVKGLINKTDDMFKTPLKEVILKNGSMKFMVFVENTLVDLADEFNIIRADKSTKKLIMEHACVSEKTYEKYISILIKANVIRKVNNKTIALNPYQIYFDSTISGEKLWQLQANWELGNVMTKWLSLRDEERLEAVKEKAKIDSIWSSEEIKKIKRKSEDVKLIIDKSEIFLKIIKSFMEYAKSSGMISDNVCFVDYMSNEMNARRFRSWYLKWTSSKHYSGSKDAILQYRYQDRKLYTKAFMHIVTLNDNEIQSDTITFIPPIEKD